LSKDKGFHCIFPLRAYIGTYQIHHFKPELLQSRCHIADILVFFEEIYKVTEHFKPIRKQFKMFVLFVIVTLLLLILCITFLIYEIVVEKNSPDLSLGIALLVAFLMFYGVLFLCYCNLNRAKLPTLRKQISEVVESYRNHFDAMGLRWILPENCQWIELTNIIPCNFSGINNDKNHAPLDSKTSFESDCYALSYPDHFQQGMMKVKSNLGFKPFSYSPADGVALLYDSSPSKEND